MIYKCPECGFTGEGWHRWSCTRGKPQITQQPITPVLDHFDNVLRDTKDKLRPEMLPVVKDSE